MEKKPAPTTTSKKETAALQQAPAKQQAAFNKKLLFIGGGVVAVIVAIIVAMLLLAGPTKSDYNEAVTTMRTVRDSYREVDHGIRRMGSGLLFSSGSSSDTVSVEKELKTYQENVAKLKDMKALRDKEVKQAYDAFMEKHDKFVPYIEGTSKSLADYIQMNKTCNALSSIFRTLNSSVAGQSAAEFDKKMEPCKKAIEKLKQSKNETFAKFGDKLAVAFKDAREAAFKVANVDSSDILKPLEARTEMLKAVRLVGEAMRQFSKDLRENIKSYDMSDKINTLGKLLVKKYQEAK